ncbi:hypothetical protein TVAG_136590 [Trichomonas vaginalis G3]|uniref:Uncharacterized protein n=1 Tax=Trichomonas vaginalis (strain ATCC PRA-98 / G3) TaxID=412133 RepID=A2DJE1_TRIV3|nr:hypothetical protein TVAGG3_0543260 [Trichomonas vaginalis G3]EAY19528.1 hypothetical protein TVAG_136590 [Trichomonas vaginalis G3]KAI5519990.1 hypothetical protein TVAGG3_0543260 [Trichomonas vaginalis G3]|eukprot:XP_001580514.1 hypothetical protein [Trichomonas vaginalis G3]
MFPNQASYLNFHIIHAYVKEIVARKTIRGGGREMGITIDEIYNELSFILSAQFGFCPINKFDIQNALVMLENNQPVFLNFVSPDHNVYWRLTAPVQRQPMFFEPVKQITPESKMEMKKTPSAIIDYSIMLKSEEELMMEMEVLRKKKANLEKENNRLRASARLLQDPILLTETIRKMDVERYNASLATSYVDSKVDRLLDNIDSTLSC